MERLRAEGLWQDNTGTSLDYSLRVEDKTGTAADAGSADGPTSQSKFGGVWDNNEYDGAFSPVNISRNGRFCRLAARDGSMRCLIKMTEMIERMHMWLPEIHNLTLFVQKPLLRYLRVMKARFIPQDESEVGSAAAPTDPTKIVTGVTTASKTVPPLQAKSQRKEAQFKERWVRDYPDSRTGATDDTEYSRVCADLFSVLIRWKAELLVVMRKLCL